GGSLRGGPGRRPREGRDALPPRRLRPLRGVQGPPLQPRNARGAIQRKIDRRRARPECRRRARVLREPAAHPRETGALKRRRTRVHPPGPVGDNLVGRRSQRVKLATELAKRDTGRTLYILDEPT